jgi:hypothetical protein
MLSVVHGECRKQAHYAEYCYAECRYAECRGALDSANKMLTWRQLAANTQEHFDVAEGERPGVNVIKLFLSVIFGFL